jgi:hypothetical protein
MNKLAFVYVRQWLFLAVLAVSTVWLPVVIATGENTLVNKIFYSGSIGVILAAFTAKAIKDLLAMKLDRELRRQIVSIWMVLGGGTTAVNSFCWVISNPVLFAVMIFWGVVLLSLGFARFRDSKKAANSHTTPDYNY